MVVGAFVNTSCECLRVVFLDGRKIAHWEVLVMSDLTSEAITFALFIINLEFLAIGRGKVGVVTLWA